MGCFISSARHDGGGTTTQDHADMTTMVVFAPAMRVPKRAADFSTALHGLVPTQTLEELSSLQARIIALALALAGEATSSSSKSKSRRKSATQHGGTTVGDLLQASEEYLPLLLGLVKEGSGSTNMVQFVWRNQEDAQQETSISNSYYEVLSVLHLMAVLELMRANTLLSSKTYADNYQTKTTEDKRKEAIDVFLKVSGILESAIKVVMPKMSEESKENLPADLKEGVLCALSMQALGQSVEIQLGLAIDNMKATLAVKRRLACEQVKYWKKAHENIGSVHVGGFWGGKHRLYISWKLAEAKAAAFYFHGLILDEGSEEGTHAKAVVCLQTALSCLKESQKLCASFCMESPTTRATPVWGAMKYLTEKIPRDYTSKAQIHREMYHHEKLPDQVSELPDFPLSLHPDEFKLPGV